VCLIFKAQYCPSTHEGLRESKITAWNNFNFGPGWIPIRFSLFYFVLCTLYSYCRKKLGDGPHFCPSASYLEDHKYKLPVKRLTFGSLDLPRRSVIVR